jgi:hypothetical protein
MNQSNSFLTYIVYFSYFVTVTKKKVTNTGLNFFAITLLAQIVTCPSPIREVKLACLFLIKKKKTSIPPVMRKRIFPVGGGGEEKSIYSLSL